MSDMINKSVKKILLESIEKCETIEQKFEKIVDTLVTTSKILDILINILPVDQRIEVIKKLGFKELKLD